MEAFVHVSELEFLLFVTIGFKTSLNQVIAVKLDTSCATTILTCLELFDDICTNNSPEEGANWIRSIREVKL